MMEKAEIYYLKETDEGMKVERLLIDGYQIPQLNRIEDKLDELLVLIKDKERLDNYSIGSSNDKWDKINP